MENIANLVSEYGLLVVIAIIFLYFVVIDKKNKDEERKQEKENNNKVFTELSSSNRNIAESLNLLKTSLDTNTTEYRQHDERAIEQFKNINDKLIRIEEKVSK